MKIEGKEYRTIWFENNIVKIIVDVMIVQIMTHMALAIMLMMMVT